MAGGSAVTYSKGSGVAEEPKSISQVVRELWQLLLDYGKQETVDPLKRLGRFAAFGLPAMFCLAIGLSLLLLGALRVLQTETGSTFTGSLSWLPYVCTLGAALLFGGLAVAAIFRKKGQKA